MNKALVKTLFLLSLITSLFNLTISMVRADDPSGVEMNFIPQGGFTLYVYHEVVNPQIHYIKSILIEVNDKFYSLTNFISQKTNIYQYLCTNVGASLEDVITVTAECNQHGYYKENWTVRYDDVANNHEIPAYVGLFVIGSISAIIGVLITKKHIRKHQ